MVVLLPGNIETMSYIEKVKLFEKYVVDFGKDEAKRLLGNHLDSDQLDSLADKVLNAEVKRQAIERLATAESQQNPDKVHTPETSTTEAGNNTGSGKPDPNAPDGSPNADSPDGEPKKGHWSDRFAKEATDRRIAQRWEDFDTRVEQERLDRFNELEQENKKRKEQGKGPKSNKHLMQDRYHKKARVSGMGIAGALLDGYFTYQAEREEDPTGSKLADLTKAGAVAAGWLFFEPVMWGLMAKDAIAAVGNFAMDEAKSAENEYLGYKNKVTKSNAGLNKGSLGGEFVDNEMTATMRQRQEQVMRQHKIATESILGSEARQLHR